MKRRIETTALSRRLIAVAIPVTILAVMLCLVVFVAIGPPTSPLLLYLAPAIILTAACLTIWLELRIPRYVWLDDGTMTLESFFGIRVIPDGDVLSVRNAWGSSWPRGVGPTKMVLTFKRGRRSVYSDFAELPDFLSEVRRRNPKAEIEVT